MNSRMIRSISAALLVSAMLISAQSCTTIDIAEEKAKAAQSDSAPGETVIDEEALAASIAESAKFDDTLIKLAPEAAELRYVFGYDTITAYAGTGATAEVVLVCTYADEAAAEQGKAYNQTYIDNQKDIYGPYNVKEVPKLENCIIERIGRYTVCVVAADLSGAKEIIRTAAGE